MNYYLLRKIAEEAKKTTLKEDVSSLKSAFKDLSKTWSPIISDGLRANKELGSIRKNIKQMPFYMRPEIKKDPNRVSTFLNLDKDNRRSAIGAMTGLNKGIKEINDASWYAQPFVALSNLGSLLDMKGVLSKLGLVK